MSNNSNVSLVTQTRVKPNKDHEFSQWQEKISEAVAKFPGYVSQTVMAPTPPVQPNWVIMQYFVSEDAAKAWLQSSQRQELLKMALPLLMGIEDVYLVDENKKHGQNVAIATIATKVYPESEQKFLDWQAQISPVQSKFPGFLGYKLERPIPGIHDTWVTIMTFDSEEHLDAWLNSPERKKFIDVLDTLSSESYIQKTSRGFDFWFNTEKKQSSVWKENMLVLLALYPVVFLLSYIQNPFTNHGVPFWFALFFGNAASTAILGWIAVPWLMKHFAWWVNPPERYARKNTILGTILVVALYAISLGFCWLLSYFTR